KKLWNWKTGDDCAKSGLSGSKPRPSSILSPPSDARRRISSPTRRAIAHSTSGSKTPMTGWIGIALGDLTGIGPEVTLKALARDLETDDARYLLIGDDGHVRRLNERLRPPLPLQPFRGHDQPGRVFVHSPLSGPLPEVLTPGSPVAARAALAWLSDGAQRCLRREIDALVTAPVNKEAIIRAGEKSFVGQTEYLAQLAGADRTAMMLLGEDDRCRRDVSRPGIGPADNDRLRHRRELDVRPAVHPHLARPRHRL